MKSFLVCREIESIINIYIYCFTPMNFCVVTEIPIPGIRSCLAPCDYWTSKGIHIDLCSVPRSPNRYAVAYKGWFGVVA